MIARLLVRSVRAAVAFAYKCTSSRRLAVLTFLFSVSACASGPQFSQYSQNLPDVDQAHGRIVFYRESRFNASLASPDVNIDGQKVGELSNGSVLVVDHANGDVRVSLAPMSPEPLEFPLSIEGGKELYVEVGPRVDPVFFAAGFLGRFVASAAGAKPPAGCSWDWCAQVRTKAEAQPKLSGLTVEQPKAIQTKPAQVQSADSPRAGAP